MKARSKEEAGFLKAIYASLNDDLPRLVYADWLDERLNDDKFTATSEYIRRTCGRDAPRTAHAWLRDNWSRLCPTLSAGILYPAKRRDGAEVWVTGSVVDLYYDPPYVPDLVRPSGIRIQLSFGRGFCIRAKWRLRTRGGDLLGIGALGSMVRILVDTDHRFVEYDDQPSAGE